jgi:hypothetical protein
MEALANASLQNLHEFERFGNDTTLDKITDLEDLATKVRLDTTEFHNHSFSLHQNKTFSNFR